MGRQMDNFEINACTRAAYEVNRSFCEAMGDFSHVPYESLSADLKQVAMQATIGIVTLDFNAEQSHEAWVAAKRSQGWKYGEKKDAEAKTHPCLVAWKELSFEQQAKDELWIATVKNLLAAFIRIPRQ